MSPPSIKCENYVFTPVTKQASEFIEALSVQESAKFAAACTIVARSFDLGRPAGGRWQTIRNSKVGLCELKITSPGSRGPQLRMLFVRQGTEVLLVRGFVKKQRSIPLGEIDVAEKSFEHINKRGKESKTE